jgi:TetR/AcrR family acrAB operon transcriptional repressor
MTARGLARCIEMAISGTKSVHPAMQPADAFLKDLEIMLRTLVAGAAGRSPKPHPAKPATATKSRLTKPGDRK